MKTRLLQSLHPPSLQERVEVIEHNLEFVMKSIEITNMTLEAFSRCVDKTLLDSKFEEILSEVRRQNSGLEYQVKKDLIIKVDEQPTEEK